MSTDTRTHPGNNADPATSAGRSDELARAVVDRIAADFEAGWNANDGDAYTRPLTDDADYVTIQGAHGIGREFLTAGIDELYATLYKDSRITITPTAVRWLTPDVIVAHLEHVLDIPAGPAAGRTTTLATVVVVPVDGEDDWRVAALHNTVRT